ncbi:MAG: hypothetical protein EON52_27610 [Actinomycetales bacterium]|nr:MAG: hypothetical protein EON52_27610 [Actinomycetales bacterium]
MIRRLPALVVALAVTATFTACDGSDDDPTSGGVVCGLVSPKLAAEVVGDGPVRTTGSGAVVDQDGAAAGSDCTIQPEDSRSGPFVQVSIGPVSDPADWRSRIRAEAEDLGYGTVAKTYDGTDGTGYGATYTRGIWIDGASANLVKGDRVVRVTVYRWRDATDQQRLNAARTIADDADSNLSAFVDAQD